MKGFMCGLHQDTYFWRLIIYSITCSRVRLILDSASFISSRLTWAANEGVFSFFMTDFTSIPSYLVGRIRAEACTKPESSSKAYIILSILASGSTPKYLGPWAAMQ